MVGPIGLNKRTTPKAHSSLVIPNEEFQIIPYKSLLAMDASAIEDAQQQQFYPVFVCERLSRAIAKISTKSGDAVRELKCLLYYTYLWLFNSLPPHILNDVEKRNQRLAGVPDPVILRCLRDFSEFVSDGASQRIEITPMKRSRLISHMLILALMVDNFRTSVGAIATDLKMPKAKVKDYFRTLGCKLSESSADTQTTAISTVPDATDTYATLVAPFKPRNIPTFARRR